MKAKKYGFGGGLLLVFLWTLVCIKTVYGEETGQNDISQWMEWYDFEEIDSGLGQTFGGYSFSEIVGMFVKGDFEQAKTAFTELAKQEIFGEILQEKEVMIKIILIAVLSAFLTNAALVIDRSEVSNAGFYILYILMAQSLLQSFLLLQEIAAGFTDTVISFMKIVIPAMALSVGISSGQTSALGFGETGIFLLYLGEMIIKKCILPMSTIYVVLMLMNYMVEEEVISKFAELFHSFVQWFLKCFLGLVLGLNLIKGMLLPAIDSAEKNMAVRLVNLIPGADSVTNMGSIFLSSAQVIKNAMGAGFVFCIFVLAMYPCLKVLIFSVCIKMIAAVIQPMTDRRISQCVDATAQGALLIQKILLTQVLFVVLSVAILCMMT